LHPCQADAFTDQIPRTATIVSSLTISGIPAFNGQQPGARLARTNLDKRVSLPRGGLAQGILLFLDTGQFNPTLIA